MIDISEANDAAVYSVTPVVPSGAPETSLVNRRRSSQRTIPTLTQSDLLSSQKKQKRSRLLNILLFGLAGMFNGSAIWAGSVIMQAVVQTLTPPRGSFVGNEGYMSGTIRGFIQLGAPYYGVLVYEQLGQRLTLFIGMLIQIGFCAMWIFRPAPWQVYVTSALYGIGQSLMWTMQGVVLNDNSATPQELVRNQGIFWFLYSWSIWGHIFNAVVFGSSSNATDDIDVATRQKVYGVLTVMATAAVVITIFIRPMSRAASRGTALAEAGGDAKRPTMLAKLGKLLLHPKKLFKTIKTFLLMPAHTLADRNTLIMVLGPTIYVGLQVGFYGMPFPAAVGFTQQFGAKAHMYISLSTIMNAVGGMVAGLFVSTCNKYVSRTVYFSCAFASHLIAYALCAVTLPPESPLRPTSAAPIFGPYPAAVLLAGFFLGTGNGLCQTQLDATLTEVCKTRTQRTARKNDKKRPDSDDEFIAPTFALVIAMKNILFAIFGAYSSVLLLPYHFVIIIPMAVWGVACYIFVERDLKRKRFRKTVSEQSEIELNGRPVTDQLEESMNTG